MIQWHISDPSEVCSDSGDPPSERVLFQALLEDKQFLVHWKRFPDEDATWEGENILEYPTLKLLGDKQHLGGDACHVLPKLIWNKTNYCFWGQFLR